MVVRYLKGKFEYALLFYPIHFGGGANIHEVKFSNVMEVSLANLHVREVVARAALVPMLVMVLLNNRDRLQ